MANLSSKTGFTPTTTRVSLANNTATTVQNMSAYDGQILTGFVYVDATTDYRAVVIVQVVKNGAGTYEVAAADISGDDISGSPIVTFSMSGTNLVATLPNFTGFASAYIQYKLDAPALGQTFPLTVETKNILGGTNGLLAGAGYIGEIKYSSSSTINESNGQNITGSYIQLTKGNWIVSAFATVGNTAPTVCSIGISTTPNSAAVNSPVTNYPTRRGVIAIGNTANQVELQTDSNMWHVTANQNVYPVVNISSPVSSGYSIDFYIIAQRYY
jgi:hypothetical protein